MGVDLIGMFPIFTSGGAGDGAIAVFTNMEFALEAEPDITVDTDDLVITADPDVSIQAEPEVQVESD